jgi:hypothetical protein
MREDTLRLFDEFAASFAHGTEPDVRELLVRAGDDAPALARLVDSFLAGSEPPEPEPERVELMRAWARGEPPLLELRKSRRLKRAELVSRLTALLGLAPDREAKVGRYYHELEGGLLEARGVDARVWDALRQVLGTDVRSLARWRPAAQPRPAALYRGMHLAHPPVAAAPQAAAAAEADAEQDEVDRLFRSGS